MKKILAIFWTGLLILLTFSMPTFAEEAVETKIVPFETMISVYFENPNETEVLNKDGVNITEEFFAKNSSAYESKNYDVIREFLNTNVGRLKCQMESQEQNLERMDATKTVRDYEVIPIESQGHKGFLKMDVGGTFTYNRNTGEISSAYNPRLISVEVDRDSFYDWTFKHVNVTTDSWVSGDKFTAYFKASLQTLGYYQYSFTEFDFGYQTCTISSQAGA